MDGEQHHQEGRKRAEERGSASPAVVSVDPTSPAVRRPELRSPGPQPEDSAATSQSSAATSTSSAASSSTAGDSERDELLHQLSELGESLLAKQAEVNNLSEKLVATQSALFGTTEELKKRDERIALLQGTIRKMEQEVEQSRRTAAEKSALADLGSIGRSQAVRLSKLEVLVEHLNNQLRDTRRQLEEERAKNIGLTSQQQQRQQQRQQSATETAPVATVETPTAMTNVAAPIVEATAKVELQSPPQSPPQQQPRQEQEQEQETSKSPVAAESTRRHSGGKAHHHGRDKWQKKAGRKKRRACRKRSFTTV